MSEIADVNFSGELNFIKSIVAKGNILEVDCAAGGLLNALKGQGFNMTGVELSSYAAEYGKKNYGINIINKPTK
jgi:2-polyprenyl-3-methyl-5-hydroxy-6-metoxy-1,4-benzoquinol methylase